MNVDPKFLELPGFSLFAAVTIVLVFLGWLVIYLLLKHRQSRLDERTLSWLNLLHYAQKREIFGKELRPLREFFLTLSEKERGEIPQNKALFRKLFLPFIENYKGIDEAQKVIYIEKLVPEIPVSIEIEEPRDLYPGEAVAVELGEENYLGFVVKIKENYGLFSLPHYHPTEKHLGLAVNVHAYRHGHGSFSMDGVIQKVFPDGFAILFSGKVTSTGNQHLMAILEWPLEFKPWPSKATLPQRKEDSSEKAPSEIEIPEEIKGVSEKVSDRAMLVKLQDSFPKKALHLQEIWRMVATLPSGEELKIRVKLYPSPQQVGKYIARYLDIDEATRIKLWEIIRANKPIREHIN